MVNKFKSAYASLALRLNPTYVKAYIAAWMLSFALIMGGAAPTYAQTPVPTLAIAGAVASMFTSANGWMVSLSDVLSIGFGITIALAVLGLVGYIIVKALQSARTNL